MANGTQSDSTDTQDRAATFLRQKGVISEPQQDRARQFLQRQGVAGPESDIDNPESVQRARQFLQRTGQPTDKPRPEEGFGAPEVPEPDQQAQQQLDQQLERRINVLQKREHQLTEQLQGLREEAEITLDIPKAGARQSAIDPKMAPQIEQVESRRDSLRQQRLDLISQRDDIRDEEKGFWKQAWEALTKTGLRIQQMPSIMNLQTQADLVNDLERIDSGELKIAPQSDSPSPFANVESTREIKLRQYQAMDPENRKEFKRNLGREMVGSLVETENLERKIQAISEDPTIEQMMKARTSEEALEIFMTAPVENTMSLGFTSLPYMVPSIIGGIVGGLSGGPVGAGVGVGLGSGVMEFHADMTNRIMMEAHRRTGITTDDIMAEMEEAGFDTSNVDPNSLYFGKDAYMIPEYLKQAGEDSEFKQALTDVVSDQQKMREFGNQAALKATGVALGDAAGAFIPASTITSQLLTKAAGSTASKAGRIATSFGAGMLVDASSGAAGEAMGQMMADGELQPGEVQAEFFGEFFGSPVQITTTVAASARQQRAQQRLKDDIKQIARQAQARQQGAPTEGRPFRYTELSEQPTRGPREQQAYSWVLNNLDEMDQNYNARVLEEFDVNEAKIVSSDEAKYAIPGFGPEQSANYHEPASGYAKLKYEELLADEGTQDQPVLVLSGGSGAGKTSSLRLANFDLDGFAATYDTNLNSFGSAKTKIDQALESGREVEIVHTFREPVEAFVNGVIPRVASRGRIVPVDAHVATHLGARQTLFDLIEEYGDNENVSFGAIDNSRGKGEATPVAIDQLPEIDYTEESLTEALNQAVDDALRQQKITPQEAATFKGQDSQNAQAQSQQGPDQGTGRITQQTSDREFVTPPFAPTGQQTTDPETVRNNLNTFRRKHQQAIPQDENFIDKIRKSKFWPFSPQSKTRAESRAENLLRTRAGDIGVGMLDSFEFRNEIAGRHSEQELQAITFIMEKTNAPDNIANRDEIQALIDSPTEQMEQTVQEVRQYLDEAHQFLMENLGEDLGFIENYVPHIWDIPQSRMDEVVNWFVTENPSTKKRIIPTIKAGMDEMGLTPRSTNIERLLSIYDEFKTKTVANIQFVEGLVQMTDEYGEKLVKRIDQAPAGWVEVDHPVLRRGVAVGTNDEQVVILKVPVKVHPEIAPAVKAVLDQPFNGKWIKALTTVNAFLKKSWLTLSFFHHVALSEVGLATPGMAKETSKIAGSFLNVPKLYRAISNNDYEYLKNLDVAKDGVRHGLQLGAISDVHRDQVGQALESIESKFADGPLKLFRKGATKIRRANEKWDKALWDYMHNTLKIQGYESLVAYNSRQRPDADPETIKLEAAQQVNDTFGGQTWELLLKSPKWKQVMHLILLSPDWTWSTARQFASIFGLGSVTGTKTGRDLRKKMGRAFWARATIFFLGGMNILNHTLTKGKYGQGRFMWENDPGEQTNLEICNYPDGTKKYLRWGKQFREIFEFVEKPIEKISAKFSPVVQEGAKQITGESLSGFPTEFSDQSFWESILPSKGNLLPDRFEEIARSPIPFSIRNQIRNGEIEPLSMAFPISRGLTPYATRAFFEQAINRRDASYISEIAQKASENNLNPKELLTQTVAQMQSNRKQELRREYGVRDFEDLPFSVQAGYQQWRNQLKAYQNQVEFVVEPWEDR